MPSLYHPATITSISSNRVPSPSPSDATNITITSTPPPIPQQPPSPPHQSSSPLPSIPITANATIIITPLSSPSHDQPQGNVSGHMSAVTHFWGCYITSSSSGSVTKPQVSSFVAKSNSWNKNGNKKFDNNKMVRNSTNNRGPNPNLHCTNCGKVGHTVDRCFDIIGYPLGYNKNIGPKSNGPRTFNANFVFSYSEKGASLSFTNEQMIKLMNLINEAPSGNVQANMAGHPNGTLPKIKYVRNFKLSDKIVLFDVLVVLEICIKTKLWGLVVKNGGIYMFDYVYPLSFNSQTIGNLSAICFISKSMWHTRLGHPSNQAVSMLQHDLNFTKDSYVSPCDICHKAKQTREPFPFSDHHTTEIGELIHLYLFPSSVLNGKSPFELVFGFKPKLCHLRSFGCLCFSSILNNSDKFSSKSEKYVLISFSTTKKAYKVYSLESKMIYYSRDIKFYENIFPFKMIDSLQKEQSIFSKSSDNNVNGLNFFDEKHSDFQTSLSPNDDRRVYDTPYNDSNDHSFSSNADECEDEFATSIDETSTSEGNVYINSKSPAQGNLPQKISQGQPDLRRSSRVPKMPAKFNDYVVNSSKKYGLEKYVTYTNLNTSNYCFSINLNKSSEPTSYFEAVKNPNWIEAINNEIEALNRNNTCCD
ncbi:ribonuclease H-like domain-containing protein [Tanacetum coccineum]